MDVGRIIKSARLSKNMTQEELAEKVGVQKSAVAKWENGRVSEIKRSNLKKLADALGLKPVVLLGDIEADPEGLADILSDLFEVLDEPTRKMFQEYISLEEIKQSQVREYVHLLYISANN